MLPTQSGESDSRMVLNFSEVNMKEIWIETGNNKRYNSIVAISNTGLLRTKDGQIRESKFREVIRLNGKLHRVHQIIAEHFIPKTQEDLDLGRNIIDHKTHEPDGMNINDVRNLRWCTNKENSNFDEARKHFSEGHTGLRYPRNEFGRKFYEHYGFFSTDNRKLFNKEKEYYIQHNKCSWE